MSTDNITLRRIVPEDAPAMEQVINNAFRHDHFFKKPEYYNRVSVQSIKDQQLNEKNHFYVVGTLNETDEICACVYGVFSIDICSDVLTTDSHAITLSLEKFRAQGTDTEELHTALQILQQQPESKFSLNFVTTLCQVSVSEHHQGKGLGKKLIAKSEEYFYQFAPKEYLTTINEVLERLGLKSQCTHIDHVSRLEVLSRVRPELPVFYSKLGYKIVNDDYAFAELYICLPEYRFNAVVMDKAIGLWDSQ